MPIAELGRRILLKGIKALALVEGVVQAPVGVERVVQALVVVVRVVQALVLVVRVVQALVLGRVVNPPKFPLVIQIQYSDGIRVCQALVVLERVVLTKASFG